MIDINKNEVVRYLGYRGITKPDEHLNQMIDECIKEMQEKVSPRKVYTTFPILWESSAEEGHTELDGNHVDAADSANTDDTTVNEDAEGAESTEGEVSAVNVANTDSSYKKCSFAGIGVSSGNLLKNLKGCSEIVLLAVTLGPVPDMLVRRSEVRDIMRAYTYQAVGAAMVEAWCDEVNDMIIEESGKRGLYARPRFSPGYGDFPLEVQKDFEKILDMPKSIGVTLSDSLLMTSTKSITAVIGLSETDADCHKGGCEVCSMHETCEFSR